MYYVEAPKEYDGSAASLFLAGGITGCEPWQMQLAAMLQPAELTVLNPRRASFPIDDPTAAEAQIEWEFRHLARATAALFWFPPPTVCPIALYELGRWSAGDRPLFVGTAPDYARAVDVRVQLRLARPEVAVVDSLDELAGQVAVHFARDKPTLGVP